MTTIDSDNLKEKFTVTLLHCSPGANHHSQGSCRCWKSLKRHEFGSSHGLKSSWNCNRITFISVLYWLSQIIWDAKFSYGQGTHFETFCSFLEKSEINILSVCSISVAMSCVLSIGEGYFTSDTMHDAGRESKRQERKRLFMLLAGHILMPG